MRSAGLVALAGLACTAPAPPSVEALPRDAGLEVRADRPVARVWWRDARGRVVVDRVVPAPTATVLLAGPWTPGQGGQVEVLAADGTRATAPVAFPGGPGPAVALALPAGSEPVGVADGATVDVPRLGDGAVPVRLVARAAQDGPLTVRLGPTTARRDTPAGGRLAVDARVDAPVDATVEGPGGTWTATLRPARIDRAVLDAALVLAQTPFPADRDGAPDAAQARDRLVLPARWWADLLRRLPGVGFRPRDVEVPRAWQGVTLRNDGEAPLDVAVRLRILDEAGRPAAPFRPRARRVAAPDGAVSALLRIPPGRTATTALPVWIDEAALPAAGGAWRRELSLAAVGDPEPLRTHEGPLVVRRAGSVVTGTAVAAVGVALIGVIGLLGPGLSALRRAATRDLVTVAVFSSLLFVVGAVGQVLGLSVAAVLGPFGPFLTGLVDDALRVALLATLITLVPRAGTLALAVVLGWLLRGLALGGFSVVDVLFVGGQVAWLEGWAALAGLTTTGGRWRDGAAWVRGLRLVLAFVGASLCTAAAGLALQVVLYRLWLDPTYVAALLAGPSGLYVAVAALLAVPFADSLRRVAG